MNTWIKFMLYVFVCNELVLCWCWFHNVESVKFIAEWLCFATHFAKLCFAILQYLTSQPDCVAYLFCRAGHFCVRLAGLQVVTAVIIFSFMSNRWKKPNWCEASIRMYYYVFCV